MKQKFCVIGFPLGHTMSPFIHRRLFALSGTDADYGSMEISPMLLPQKIDTLLQLDGFNITVPHKQAVIPYLDYLDESAQLYGAVNTVKCGDTNIGYNTDAFGFLKALSSAGIALCGHILICGAGGAARAMAFEAVFHGCNVSIATRPSSSATALHLKAELEEKIPGCVVKTALLDELNGDFDLLINATPCGMHPNPDHMPVSLETVERCSAVFDAVYNPRETLLLRTARERGIPCAKGMPMLVWQAAKAHEIWYDAKFDEADIRSLVIEANEEMQRIFCSQPR